MLAALQVAAIGDIDDDIGFSDLRCHRQRRVDGADLIADAGFKQHVVGMGDVGI
jgi:hypothetical protein